jgi:hypothetical protein
MSWDKVWNARRDGRLESWRSVASRLSLGEFDVRPSAGFEDALDILFQQVDRHCQKDDIFH